MIPSEGKAQKLWDKYNLPEHKRQHVMLVARVAKFLAEKLSEKNFKIKTDLLVAGALLHDIDKNIPKLPGESHPDAALRALREEGMEEVARLIKTHPLHAILDARISPKTLEEKILFLADKMVKLEIITVNKRFDLWRAENLPPIEKEILGKTYSKVKELEKEIFGLIKIKPGEVAKLLQ